jgi:flagellar biosynthetic protein FliQ
VSDAAVLDIVSGALMIATKLAGPILLVCLFVGVAVALIQTVTQVQEMTLTFVPKLIGTAAVLLIGGHWMLQQLVTWVRELWQTIPTLG